MSTIPSSTSAQPDSLAQRRPSSSRLGGSSPPFDGDSLGLASVGHDVTPTSPSKEPSVVSLRPLLSPSGLYEAPPSVPPLERTPSVASPRPAFPSAPSPPPSSSLSTVSSDSSASPTPPAPPQSIVAKGKENTGRWLTEEHEVFLRGLNEHGKQWKKIAMMIRTRSVVQVRTHAQKYFQKLQKIEKKEEGRLGKERSPSIISTSTAVSTSISAVPAKRKSSTKGNKTTAIAAVAMTKKRRVSLEPKPKKQQLQLPLPEPTRLQPPPPQLIASAPPMPSCQTVPSSGPEQTVIDPSFMNGLNMAEGELDDSILDLLDDSSVEAVEQVIGSDDDLEPNRVEPNPVSPSVSSASLADNNPGAVVLPSDAAGNRQEIVTSPNPEDFSIHNTIGTSSIVGQELSPTSVAITMDIKDFDQKTSNYMDALDWLMDVGVHQLPATAGEAEEDWANGSPSGLAVPVMPKPPLSVSKLAQVNSSALSVLDGDVF